MIQFRGWVDDPREVDRQLALLDEPTMCEAAPHLADSGRGKKALLYKTIKQVTGGYITQFQKTGDCVSMGLAQVANCLTCVEIALKHESEMWVAAAATEPIYAGSRVEIGKGRLGYGAGSLGIWAAKWSRDYGILLRQKYGDIDLTSYSSRRADQWGAPRAGCPDALEPIAKEHPIRQFTKVANYEEARDAIANGYPVTVASNQGFTTTRDSDGFLRPRGSWAHQMAFLGMDDEFKRPGLLCQNSWGGERWVSGPTRHEQPPGSFWVDASAATSMLRQGDSFAYANFDGFPIQEIDYLLI